MKKVQLSFALFMTSHLFFSSVLANEPKAIQLTMTAFEEIKVINEQGSPEFKLIEPSSVVPGDTVVYITKYHNQSTLPAKNIVITNPIPKHLIYIRNTAEQGVKQDKTIVSYSIDRGESFKAADKLMMKTTGNTLRPATPKDYTHVRWTINSVSADSKGSVRFSAKLN